MSSELLQPSPEASGAEGLLAHYVYVFYVAYILAFVLTPLMRQLALRLGIVDRPDGRRKVHAAPVAYLGGVAVFLGCVAGVLTSGALYPHWVGTGLRDAVRIDWWLLAGALVIVVVGLLDDARGIRPWQKITGQIAAGACLSVSQLAHQSAWGLVQPILAWISLAVDLAPLGIQSLNESWPVIAVSTGFVIVLVVGCCNASNLIDGLDGLCGGVTCIVASAFLVLSLSMAMAHGPGHEQADATRIILSLALLGASLGFLPFNFNPASIFMGDAGSMFLGYTCAALMAMFAAEGELRWFLGCCVAFALPLFDMALAFVRRKVNGRPFFSADKQHFHHQLMARGLSVRQTVLACYGLALCCAILGCSIVFTRTSLAGAIYLLVFCMGAVAAYKVGMVHEKPVVPVRKPGEYPEIGFEVPVEEGKPTGNVVRDDELVRV